MSDGGLEPAVAACLFPGFEGLTAPDWLRDAGFGGVVLFARNIRDPAQVAELTASLPGLLIAVDEEGGDVTRLELAAGSSYPGNYALGIVDDVDLTERVAAAIGADLAAVGIGLNLAPVADVNTNPDNPIIGIRAFGADPALVSRHVAAFVSGLQGAGVGACAKHFPGHGDTHQDSHLELPEVEWDERALEPFRAAVEAGVRAIMTAHVVVRGVDEVPATLSRRLLGEVLRGDLGFDGAVLTDALEMRALSATVGVEEAAVRSLAAGADGLLLGHDLHAEDVLRVQLAIVHAVRAGRLAEERLGDAAGRVSALGASFVDVGATRDRAVGAEAARRALWTDGSVALAREPLVVELVPEPTIAAGPAKHDLGTLLRQRLPAAEVVTLHEPPRNGVVDLRARQLVLVLTDAQRFAWQRAAAQALLVGSGDAIVVETGLPGWRPDGGAGFIATHGSGRVNLAAAVDALLG